VPREVVDALELYAKAEHAQDHIGPAMIALAILTSKKDRQ
jgi:hypothetical protein